jgi:outer membrane protein OmpA-like peptidoglycan-associated protein
VRFTPVVTGPLAADPTWVNQVECSAKVSADGADVTSLTEPADNYVTQCTGPSSSGTGIDVVYVNGTHTITKRPLEITVKNRVERKNSTWNGASPGLSTALDRTEYAITSGDLVGTDSLSVTVTKGGSPSATTASWDQYPITGALENAGEASRYDVTFVPGVLTISNKTFIVTAKNQTKLYGDVFDLDNANGWTCQASDPADDATCVTNLGPVTLTSLGTSETADKGPYAIESSATESSDYAVVNTNGGLLTVTKRPITVTPSSLTVNAGSAIPNYDYAISNWNSFLDIFQGNNPDGFEAPTCTSGYTPSTPRGTTLAITCSGGYPGDNYYFVYESATLTVPGFSEVAFLTPDAVSANPSTGSVVVPFEFTITPFLRVCYATLVVTNLSGNFEVIQGLAPTNIIERRVLVDSSNLRFNLDLPEGEYEYTLVMDGNCAAEPVTRGLSIAPASNSSSSVVGSIPGKLMPQPQAITPSRAKPGTRTDVQIEGQNLAQVVEIRIGGKKIRNVTATETALNFRIPKLKPGRYDILLVMRDGTTQRWQQKLRITGKATASAPSREFAGFAAGSSKLTSAMRASITRYLNANKANFKTIECVGYTDGPFIRRTDVPLSMGRAKKVCDLARSLGYEVLSRSYVNEKEPGAELRRVKLILGK